MTGDQEQERPSTGGDAVPLERSGWNAVVDGLSVRAWIAVAVAIAVVVLGFGAWWTFGLDRGAGMRPGMGGGPMDSGADSDMAGMDTPDDVARFPPVAAYYDGERVFFAHTETSDPEISETLTGMMGSPVVTVPELAQTPEDTLGPVYVFTDGVRPDGARGPLGYQPDVFDTVPGDAGYTPLRQLVLLNWDNDAEARLLTSSAQIDKAVEDGELAVEHTGVVINAPLLVWPDGQR